MSVLEWLLGEEGSARHSVVPVPVGGQGRVGKCRVTHLGKRRVSALVLD